MRTLVRPRAALRAAKRLCAVTLVVALLGGSAATKADVVAYWRFENGTANATASGSGTILDSSGHGLNGTPVGGPNGNLVGGPIYRADVAASPVPSTGAPNTLSLDCDGFVQSVFVPDNPLFQQTHSLTLEAYVKVRSNIKGGDYIVFRGDDRGGLDPYALAVDGFGFDFLNEDAVGNVARAHAPIPALNQWFFIAGTLDDATGTMSLYIDGSLVNSIVTAERPFAVLDPTQHPGLGIGGTQSDGQVLDGLVDEVRISDTALLPGQFLNAVPEPSMAALLVLSGIGCWACARVGPLSGYSKKIKTRILTSHEFQKNNPTGK